LASKTTEARMKLHDARKHLKWATEENHPLVRERFLWDTIQSLVEATDCLSRVLEEKIPGEADEA